MEKRFIWLKIWNKSGNHPSDPINGPGFGPDRFTNNKTVKIKTTITREAGKWSTYCTVFVVCNLTMTPNVQCLAVLDNFTLRVHYLSLLNTNLQPARLLKTPLDLLHLFIYDSTSRHYNLSFTMCYDHLMSCLGAVL
jgi:hypothetical protein